MGAGKVRIPSIKFESNYTVYIRIVVEMAATSQSRDSQFCVCVISTFPPCCHLEEEDPRASFVIDKNRRVKVKSLQTKQSFFLNNRNRVTIWPVSTSACLKTKKRQVSSLPLSLYDISSGNLCYHHRKVKTTYLCRLQKYPVCDAAAINFGQFKGCKWWHQPSFIFNTIFSSRISRLCLLQNWHPTSRTTSPKRALTYQVFKQRQRQTSPPYYIDNWCYLRKTTIKTTTWIELDLRG